jgi:23S rRNA (adenine2030-N6)-methyltransferase
MLAYRHAFHAGNHADVLKHLVLVQVLERMAEKDKPYTLIDTHAGAGGYSLESRYAQRHAEWADGIGRLWNEAGLPPALARYIDLVRQFDGGGARAEPTQYPGSPGFARALLRPVDRLRAYELHPTDHKILAAYLADRPNTQVQMADGFAALPAELPPPSRRGVLLIDPSYELKSDYGRVVVALREALTRFATGTVMIWLPQVQLVEANLAPKRLASAAAGAPRGWLHAQLHVAPPTADGFGLTGSSMFVANPPFGLRPMLDECLPVLAQRLGRYDKARWSLDVGQ